MKKRPPEVLEFCDLSYDLDSRLRFLADLTQATDPQKIIFDDCLSECGHNIIEYLGRRTLLEHVFFGRSLRSVQLDDEQIKAELWRLYKIKARHALNHKLQKKTEKHSTRSKPSRRTHS